MGEGGREGGREGRGGRKKREMSAYIVPWKLGQCDWTTSSAICLPWVFVRCRSCSHPAPQLEPGNEARINICSLAVSSCSSLTKEKFKIYNKITRNL